MQYGGQSSTDQYLVSPYFLAYHVTPHQQRKDAFKDQMHSFNLGLFLFVV